MPNTSKIEWVNYKDRSLEITRKTAPKFEDWVSLMETFNQMAESSPFWRGDLYLKGEEWYGENKATSIFEADNWQLKTWQNNASICKRVDPSRRREQLSYSHHAEVAYIDPENLKDPQYPTAEELQIYYLQMAIDNHLSVRQLRDKINSDTKEESKTKGKFVSFSTRPLHERLSDTAEKILEWREEAGGDIYDLMTTAWESLSTAAEIAKDKMNNEIL